MNSRKLGIDLLRIIAMFYVMILHCLNRGGALEAASGNVTKENTLWMLQVIAYCGANVFALISGYGSYSEKLRRVKPSKYIMLWLEVVLCGVIISTIYMFKHPGDIEKKNILEMCFPISNGLYWYFIAYTGLFLVKPILDAGIRKVRNGKAYLVLLIVIFSMIGSINDVFRTKNGYSFAWILILYIIGALMRKEGVGQNIKIPVLLIVFVAMHLFTWIWAIKGIDVSILSFHFNDSFFVDKYNSITILLIAMIYIILFSRMKIEESSGLGQIVRFSSRHVFAAYLINTQRYIWIYYMDKRFLSMAQNKNTVVLVAAILIFSFLFLTGSVAIDKIRSLLMKLLKMDVLVKKVDSLIQ